MNNIALLALIDFENWNNQNCLSFGGATGVIKSLLPHLQADLIYLIGITSEKSKLNKKIKISNNIIVVPIIYIPENSKIPIRIRAFIGSRKINSVIYELKVNSIYSHSEEMLFWIKKNQNILYHMHGSSNALVKAKIKLFRNKLFQILWEYVRIRNIKIATKIIAIDTFCYDLVKKYNMTDKTILIPNFVDTEIFYKDSSPSKLLENIKENVLLFIGRIEEVKGLELFVDTLIELHNMDKGKWKGVLIGRGTYEPIIKKYIVSRKAENLFYFAGPVFEQDELRRIYNRAAILMISSYFEGIPMVILESLACGKPVIATNVGGIKEFIADDKMCFVNENRDPTEFALLIEKILQKTFFGNELFKFSSKSAAEIINQILIN